MLARPLAVHQQIFQAYDERVGLRKAWVRVRQQLGEGRLAIILEGREEARAHAVVEEHEAPARGRVRVGLFFLFVLPVAPEVDGTRHDEEEHRCERPHHHPVAPPLGGRHVCAGRHPPVAAAAAAGRPGSFLGLFLFCIPFLPRCLLELGIDGRRYPFCQVG